MMVLVALEATKEMGQQAFLSLGQAMGQNIAHALIYKESIGAAMKAALASTLESLAGQAYMYAIYATAWGFWDLALGLWGQAADEFTAAGIFAGVGTAAAIAAPRSSSVDLTCSSLVPSQVQPSGVQNQ